MSAYVAASRSAGMTPIDGAKAAAYRPSTRKPKSCACRLARLRASRPAQLTRTSDSATCTASSARRSREPRSDVVRPPLRIASTGSEREPIHAGAQPNTAPVSSDAVHMGAAVGEDDAAVGQRGDRARPGHVGAVDRAL